MNEIWKEYKLDFKSTGLLVSNYGNVKNLYNCSRAICDNGFGYKNTSVHNLDTKKQKQFYIHRLVATLFLDTPSSDKIQVNHIDGDKSNNKASNLEWVNPKDNIKHMHESGLNFNRKNHGSITKLPNEIILNAYLEVKMKWLGIAESAKKYGMPRTTLSSIMNKRSRRDVTDNCDLIFGNCYQ